MQNVVPEEYSNQPNGKKKQPQPDLKHVTKIGNGCMKYITKT